MCWGRRQFCLGPSPECAVSYSKDTGCKLQPWGPLPKSEWNHIRECARTPHRPRNSLCHVHQTRRSFLFFTCSDSSRHIFIDWYEGGSPEELNLLGRKLRDHFKDSLDGFFLFSFLQHWSPRGHLPYTMGADRSFVWLDVRIRLLLAGKDWHTVCLRQAWLKTKANWICPNGSLRETWPWSLSDFWRE